MIIQGITPGTVESESKLQNIVIVTETCFNAV